MDQHVRYRFVTSPTLFFSREKSKKFAEQAAAIVCLRILGVPEGRVGEEDSGLVCKRKRERILNGATEKEQSKKRLIEMDVKQETKNMETPVVPNGKHAEPGDVPPELP